ncbi:MAG: acyl-CoA reductase [Balneolales bacterium]
MMHWQQQAELITKALDVWFSSDLLQQAIERTVKERLFTHHDIQYSLDQIRSSVTNNSLTKWGNEAGLDSASMSDKTILCLHAGNLPLVGFQDVIAVMLSGYKYAGKVSTKDPYLIPAFLDILKEDEVQKRIQYNHKLDNYKGLQADAVMFSGSGESIKEVRNKIKRLNSVSPCYKSLIRTAGFSMVYMNHKDKKSLKALAEAILRYEGKGCRSVAMIVSPIKPDEVIERLGELMEEYWENNPPLRTLSPKTKYRYAYNKALGKDQQIFRHILFQQDGLELDNDDIIYWAQGDVDLAQKLAESNLMRIQNIYTVTDNLKLLGFEDRMAPLASAQSPPISWKPDGFDPLDWLIQTFQNE